ncbi:hypothetical protein ACHAPG_007076 [Botrytis cinerea]
MQPYAFISQPPYNLLSAVKEYSRRIILLGKDLVDAIQSRDTKPIKRNNVMSWFAIDVMGLITFGEDFGSVRAQKQRMELWLS